MPLSDRPSAMSDVSEWFSMSMNPGATARPDASTSSRPRAPPSAPRAAIRSAAIATSSTTPGEPEPSYTVPWRMMTSYCGAAAHEAASSAARTPTTAFIAPSPRDPRSSGSTRCDTAPGCHDPAA
jgi:hypothetical protein